MRRRQFLLGAAGALAACGLPAPRSPAPDSLHARLRARAVGDDDFHRTDLYTWTTAAGIASLRTSKKLLTATASTGGFTSPYIHGLVALARTREPGHELADLLVTHPSLLRRRYAWTSPFATVMGIGERNYGNSLIRIELRRDAWIARFDPAASDPFEVVDASGAVARLEDVLHEPERIGAVYHVRLHAPVQYREYVIASDAMVERWSIATPEIAARLAAETKLLGDLRAAALSPSAIEQPAAASWKHLPSSGLVALWHASLAFDNDRYRARAAQLDAIIAALGNYDAAGPPLVVSRQAAA